MYIYIYIYILYIYSYTHIYLYTYFRRCHHHHPHHRGGGYYTDPLPYHYYHSYFHHHHHRQHYPHHRGGGGWGGGRGGWDPGSGLIYIYIEICACHILPLGQQMFMMFMIAPFAPLPWYLGADKLHGWLSLWPWSCVLEAKYVGVNVGLSWYIIF